MKKSVAEIRQIAEAAITARHAADAAKKAWEDAGSPDDDLKTAYETAEAAATTAKSQADALSQDDGGGDKKLKAQKIKRKMGYLKEELRNLGESDDDDEDDDEDDLDPELNPDKPLTLADLHRIRAKETADAAVDMVEAIEDPVARLAVKEALAGLKPSGDPDKDYRRALAIANQEKNSKILEELMRKPTPPQHRSGSGAPPRQNQQQSEDLLPSEMWATRPPFNMSKKDVIAARPKQQ